MNARHGTIIHSPLSIFHSGGFRTGFTLVEMLTVIVLIGILMSAAGLAVRKANELSKNTKAESECRELVNALLEYRSVYHKWPTKNTGKEIASASFLKPLVDPTDKDSNPRGLVFLNLTLTDSTWNDPWGRPYQVYFPNPKDVQRPKAIEACVSFPFKRPPPIQ